MRPEDIRLEFLDTEGISFGEKLEIFEVIRITIKDFNNLRQSLITKSAKLDQDYWLSYLKYSEMMCQECGISLLEEMSKEKSGGKDTFLFDFPISLQVEELLK